jgi:hypothetical protein
MKKATKKPIKTYILNTYQWRCGGGSSDAACALGTGDTRLLNHAGLSCCLGQFARQVHADLVLSDSATPYQLQHNTANAHLLKGKPYDPLFVTVGATVFNSTNLANALMRINDSQHRTIKEKIDDIREELEAAGCALKVIGHSEYAD